MDKKSNQTIESIDPRITRAKIQQTCTLDYLYWHILQIFRNLG